jgi:hypothetical protein
MKRAISGLIVAGVLAMAFAAGIAVARPVSQDVLVPGGPSSGIVQLWRDFGAYQAQVVSLAPFDEATGATIGIDVVHHEVHEGEMHHAGYTVASLANNGSIDLLFVVSNTVDAHTTWEVFAGGQVQVSMWESPTYGSLGTALVEYNMNRTVTRTAASQLYHTPSITSTNAITLVNGRILPGGTSPTTRVGGGIRSGGEWILAPGRAYLLRVTNTSGGTIAANVVQEWYEEE